MAANSATKDENKDIENLSFEAAMSELETIVRRLEEGMLNWMTRLKPMQGGQLESSL